MAKRLVMLDVPTKGDPCNGCGWCCREEVCGLALEIHAGVKAPCPFISEHDGRTWCGVVEEASKRNEMFGAHLGWRLGFGRGCLVTD